MEVELSTYFIKAEIPNSHFPRW